MGAEPQGGSAGEDRPPWLDVDDTAFPAERAAPARTPWLLAAAVVPWVVVALLLSRAGPGDGPAGPDPLAAPGPAAAPSPSTGLAPPAAPAAGDAPSPVGRDATITASGALVAVDEDEARAVAVVAARRWLTTVGPDAPSDAPAAAVYAEHLVVEGVDHPAPGAAVVTVRAIVLRVDGDAYDAVEVRRVAVPLRFDAGGAAPAGTPWSLPLAEPAPAPLEATEPIDDPDLLLAAGEALADAGYRDISVRSLHRTASWPLLVVADVRVGDHAVAAATIWLRPHLGRFVVAGTRPGAPRSSPPSDLPSSSDPTPEPEEVAP